MVWNSRGCYKMPDNEESYGEAGAIKWFQVTLIILCNFYLILSYNLMFFKINNISLYSDISTVYNNNYLT